MQLQAQTRQQQPQVQQGAGPTSRKNIEIKHVRVPGFEGLAAKFDDWAFAFKRTLRSVNRHAYDLLVRVENETSVNEDDIDLEFDSVDVHGYSAELYDIMCQACQGEALSIIRTVDDMKGLEAWAKLYKKFNPRTLARAIRLVGAVTNPPKVKELKDAEMMLDKWEEQAKTLKKDFGETFSDTVRIGIVTAMMPPSIQEYIYTTIGDKIDYDGTIQKIRAIVSNKVAMQDGPVAMDIGRVDDMTTPKMKAQEDYLWQQQQWNQQEQQQQEPSEEVDAIANVQCHRCGGWGHMARECPTAKGKGKGKGKAGHKGIGKGKGFEGKGFGGKGFGGKCYNCGEYGHRKAECPKSAASVDSEYIETASVESVWTIGEVSVQGDDGNHHAKKEDVEKGEIWNKSEVLAEPSGYEPNPDKPEEMKDIGMIDGKEMTRQAQLEFNEANVRKPLASARFVAKAGNGIWLEENGGYIENLATGEKMAVRVVNDVYVFDIEMDDGSADVVTLDSGAGCSVWPKGRHAGKSTMTARKKGVGMVAANGTPIEHYGQRRSALRASTSRRRILRGGRDAVHPLRGARS